MDVLKKQMRKHSITLYMLIDDRELDENISDEIKLLTEQGADINFQNQLFDGNTPLHIAVERNDVKCVEFLLGLDVNLKIKNDDGETAYDLAEKNGKLEIMQLFRSVTLENSENYSLSMNPECIFEFETVEDLKNMKNESKIKIVKLKKTMTFDEICSIFNSKEFLEFVSRSPGLFALDVKVHGDIQDTIIQTNLLTLLNPKRSWILQVNCNENERKVFFKKAKEFAKVVRKKGTSNLYEDSFLEFLKNECSFENFMQGFFNNLIGTIEESIFDAKLLWNDVTDAITTVIKHDGLCLRFLLAFYDLPADIENDEFSPATKKIKLNERSDWRCKRFNRLKTILSAIEMDNLQLLKRLIEAETLGSQAFSDIAWELNHFECLQELLKADSPFPSNFNNLEYDFSQVIDAANSFHEDIKSGSIEKVRLSVAKNPRIKFAYNSENKSALSVCLEAQKPEIYAFLRSRGFSHGIDLKFTEILANLSFEEKMAIENENSKYFQSSGNSHLFYILSKTTVSFNPGNYEKDFEIVRKMLEELNEIEEIQPILKAVEHVDVRIIFDFNQRGVNNMIPDKPESEIGTCFYDTGNVFVGAKDYEKRYNEIMGTLIHELSHYVMNLIYENKGKPFSALNFSQNNRYNKIIRNLQKYSLKNRSAVNSTLSEMFNLYPEDMWQSEIIVCVPEILATYRNDQDKIQEIKTYAGDLFDFFYESTLEDIKNVSFFIQPKQAIRELNDLLGTLHEVWSSKISFKSNDFDINSGSNLRLIASNAPTFSMVMILEAFYEIHREACECHVIFAEIELLNSNITKKISKAMNSSIKPYFVVNITHGSRNQVEMLSTYFESHKMGKKIILVSTIERAEQLIELFGDPEFFVHTWEDLDKITCKHLIQKLVNFQGVQIKLSKVISNSSEALKRLNFQNFAEEKLMKVGELIENSKNEFVMPRKFCCQIFKTKSSQNIIWTDKNFEELLKEGEKMKKMLLSDMAGTGKTFMLKEIAIKLKEKFPHRWVNFIDLKLHIESFKNLTFDECSDFEKYILQIFYLDLNQFDQAVFEELYDKGQTILLFDSFDEISPFYKEFVLKVIKSFEVKDGNQIWIATRSHLEEELGEAIKPTIVQLKNLTKGEQIEFLMKAWDSGPKKINFSYQKTFAANLIDQLEEITSDNNGFVGIPILIAMIAEIFKDKNLDRNEKLSFNEIYRNFIEKLFISWRERGNISKMEQNDLDFQTGIPNVMEIHQKLSIIHIFGNEFQDLTETDNSWTNEMISRVGIITKDDKSFKFLHETFAEYFAARYLTGKMNHKKTTEKFITLFLKIIVEENFKIMRTFLNETLVNMDKNKNIQKQFKITIEKKWKSNEIKGLLENVTKEGHKNILAAMNLKYLHKSVLQEIFKKGTSGKNVFFNAAISPVSLFHDLFYCIISKSNENESKKVVFEMIKEKNEDGNNVFLQYSAAGKSEEVFDDLCSVLSQVASPVEMKNLFLEKNKSFKNVLQCLALNSKIKLRFPKIWTFLKCFLCSSELFELLLEKDFDTERNALHLALRKGNDEYAKDLLRIMREELNDKQRTVLLQSEDKFGKCILHSACNCNSFSIIFECIRNVLSDFEIHVMIQKRDNENTNIFLEAAKSSVQNIFSQLFDCIQSFCNANEARIIVFGLIKEKNHYGNNVIFDLFICAQSEDIFDDFCSVLLEVASFEEVKMLFLNRNLQSKNILGCLASNNFSKINFLKLWLFLKTFLNLQELFELLSEKGMNGMNALHLAISKGNEDFVINLSKLMEDFPIELQKRLISLEDDEGCTILHLACSSKVEILATTVECISRIMTLDEIKAMFWKTNNDEFLPFQQLARCGGSDKLEKFYEVFIKISSEDEFKKMLLYRTSKSQNILHIVAIEDKNLNFVNDFPKIMDRIFGSRTSLYEMLNSSDDQGKTPLMLAEENKNEIILSLFLKLLSL